VASPLETRLAIFVQPRLLSQAPELATLAVLEVALEITVRALVAEHPTLDELAERPVEPRSLRCARKLLAGIYPLQRAVQRYRAAVLAATSPEGDDDDNLPF
jgi:hypothetical protein